MHFHQSQSDLSGCMLIDQGTSMNVDVLKLGAEYYYATRCGEIAQPPIIGGRVRLEVELFDSWARPQLSCHIHLRA